MENPDFPLTRDMKVRHKCKNRHCFAINHLELGTSRDNARDRTRDGTQQMGENHPNAKYSQEVMQEVKDSKGNGTQQERANRHNVSRASVKLIDCGIGWAHLPFRGEPDCRREVIADKMCEDKQRRQKRIPTQSDYENCWKRIKKDCKESETETYDEIPCLLYQKTKNCGYGYISFKDRTRQTHIVEDKQIANWKFDIYVVILLVCNLRI